jgi:DNA-binding NtrC family response regulator
MPDLLIVDDEADIVLPIRRFFEKRGYTVREADSIAAAVRSFADTSPDVALLDYSLADGNGIDLLRRLRAQDPTLPCVMLTAHGTIDLAVKAVKEGAEQFFTKPVELPALLVVIERLIESRRLRNVSEAERGRAARTTPDPFAGESASLRRLAGQARRVASSGVPLLICGETGSGKGVLARWIHDHGSRAAEPFVDVNCAGLSKELLESELFGHQKGAFTGAVAAKPGLLEAAHKGTLFLDEIGEMDLAVQAKLLKVVEELRFRRLGDVQDRRVDVRLIAATHRDLAALVEEGRFREDLYYRIKTVSLTLPPLRERGPDLLPMARRFLTRLGAELGRPAVRLSADAESALSAYRWPGNVRELRNVIERAVLLAPDDVLGADDLREGFAPGPRTAAGSDREAHREPVAGGDGHGLTLDELERLHIERTLREQGFRVPKAAEVLGIPRSSLYERIRKYGIELPRAERR